MRFKVSCELTNLEIPLDYRRKILSLLKTGISQQNKQVFQNLFDKNTMKDYTFSVFLQHPVFTKTSITVDNPKVIIHFSTANAELAIHFFNAFMGLKNKKLKWSEETSIFVRKIDLVQQEKIVEKEVVLKAVSPIVCRDHNQETMKDWFFDASDSQFEPILKRNMLPRLVTNFGEQVSYALDDLTIQPIKMKKTVVQFYEKQIACSIGILKITGESYLLNYLVSSGIGSLTGSGFGFVEVLK